MKDDNEKFYKVIQQEKVDLNNNELNPIGFKYNLNENKNENKIENKINKKSIIRSGTKKITNHRKRKRKT